MPIPTNEKWCGIANAFWNAWNFPNCVGAIDGKHVVITAPANSGSLYFNCKKTFSIVLMALVDANYNFIAVDIGAYGKNSDGGIFANSKLGKYLAQKKLNIPEDKPFPETVTPMPHVIIGDEAFPLKTYLVRPYPASQEADLTKSNFNKRLSRARKVVENAFGILTQKFRLYNRRIQLKPENAEKVILTTCILHNFIKTGGNVNFHVQDQTSHNSPNNFNTIRRQGGKSQDAALRIREQFARFLNSPEGRIG
ncbi:protein ALP1-like [Cryptotermes secundus]|uniref:protein ALP1-like n=1 Tax=Cryptotermes secundus TaxID=105785 RepID=UPI001454E407|nr:protein ALP1-like [Cryptotermes secundus]